LLEDVMLKFLPVAALAFAAACAGAAQPAPSAPPPPVAEMAPAPAPAPLHAERIAAVDCDVRTVRTRDGLRIEGVVQSARSFSGAYDLTIAKSGGGGSSDIAQGGPFEAVAGRTVTLSGAELSMERGARVRAVLSIVEDGREVCRRTLKA
jgi:hypothetical protein